MNQYALIMHNMNCIRNEHSFHYRCFKSDDMHIHVHTLFSLQTLDSIVQMFILLDVSSHLRMKQVVNQCLTDRTEGDLQVPQHPAA